MTTPYVIFLMLSVTSLLLIFLIPGTRSALVSVNPALIIPAGLNGISVTSNGSNILVNVTGAANLNQAQQQLLVTSLLGGLNSALYAPGGAGGLGYQYGLNVGDYLGITGPAAQVAAAYTNPLGINPAGVPSNSFLPVQSALGNSLYPGYSNLVAGAPPYQGGSAGLGGYGSSPIGLGVYPGSSPPGLGVYGSSPSGLGGYGSSPAGLGSYGPNLSGLARYGGSSPFGLGGGTSLGAYLQSQPVSSLFLPTSNYPVTGK